MVGIAAKNNPMDPMVADDVTLTVSPKVVTMVNIRCAFTKFGKAIVEKGAYKAYLSSDAAGLVPSAGAPSGGVAVGTNGAVIEDIADLSFTLITTATGLVDVQITDAGASPIYLNVVTPDGRIHTAAAIFA